MNLNEILNCVRPMIFEYEDQEHPELVECYPYRMKGTCFLIGHDQITFVVTARHVLENQARPISDATFPNNDVRIFVAEGSHDFIPLNRCIQMEGDDKCYKDLLVYRVASDTMDRALRLTMVVTQYDIPSLTVNLAPLLRPDVTLITRGYPVQFNTIDQDQGRIRLRATDLKGRLKGCDSNQSLYRLAWDPNDIHRIEKECEDNCEFDPNGMSGSPIFHEHSGQLVGVLVMGNKSIGHFISASVLYKVIREFLLGKAKNAN